ncbi:hypothetical protein A1D15_2824 [Lactiplantibacillus plantarum]|uniref:Uncharacterized protein n=1 Tax=Lactiplantibacillus plantarum TaxID=1590 RepID=A0A165IMG3_LACPN|nr:hypothetical protein N654_2912 [Lactiplantibacillus plantarum 4_3]KZU10033.1 hypothetical protein Nizo2262_0003 [Lactiplantibacillus plantarum]KZU30267.1 hypothetical protein Nizo2494_0676 [Lactiplantibacillus plantarum]KZU35127.1 hypothetical protein Nizo2741_2569 [Lactiplantibacillus plantarum]KZU69459.1 hypothetical protein Nizo2814_0727 [Lactiplantibacillus plantarum]
MVFDAYFALNELATLIAFPAADSAADAALEAAVAIEL